MRVALILLPYNLGHERVGVGAGPDRLVEHGLGERLEEAGHEVTIERVERREELRNEIGASFEVARLAAERVGAAVAESAFPLVLTGNCLNSIGIVAGLGEPQPGVVWFDAHADFSTTEETPEGFLDGMGLSILTGTGWDALRESVPGYRPVPAANVVHAGGRDNWPHEDARLEASGMAVVPPAEVGAAISPSLEALRERVADVYVHLDLDVLDPREGRVNEYAAEGGASASDVLAALEAVGTLFAIRAAALSAYDPDCDRDEAIPAKAAEFATRIVGLAADVVVATP